MSYQSGDFARCFPLLFPLFLLCMLLLSSCGSSAKIGGDRYGPKTIIISQSNLLYEADPTKDTVVMMDTVPFVSGDTVVLVVEQADVLLFEDTQSHRFRDVSGTPLVSVHAYDLDNETVAQIPLRDDPDSPVHGVLLSDTGTYILRYQISGQGKRWEIDRQ